MIYLGLNHAEKQTVITDVEQKQEIRKTYIFYYRKKPDYKSVNAEYIEWDDVIMYKYFFRLLEEIGKDSLIVVDEMLRTQNRSELTYNCLHHYLNQCGARLIFQYFPIIEDIENVMILLDFEDKVRSAGKSFRDYMLQDFQIQFIDRSYTLNPIWVQTSIKEKHMYEAAKEKLFENFGKDPDNIPRKLSLFVGQFKLPSVDPEKHYLIRNKRFKGKHFYTYRDEAPSDCIILDPPQYVIQLHDYLKQVQIQNIYFLHTGLKVDEYYMNYTKKINEIIRRIYAGLYK